jgi:hypothetical protein
MQPVVVKVSDISAQILLKSPALTLSLSVSLQMVCGTKASIDVQVIAESCPELQGELGPAIGSDALRYTSVL